MMSARDTAVDYSATVVEAKSQAVAEPELVAALRAGSVEAFNYLIAVYHQPLYHLVFRMLGDAADTADTLQEVFLKVFRAASGFEGKSSLKTWLYRIAVHEACNHRRWWKRHKRQELSLDESNEEGTSLADSLADRAATPLRQTLDSERARHVQKALDAVPEPYHTALLLREIEGFSYEEMAEILNVRMGTVKSRLIRGREMLRRLLLDDPQSRHLFGLTEERV